MVGRGELGYVMSLEAYEGEIMGERAYISCIWALSIATALSPFMLAVALKLGAAPHIRPEESTDYEADSGTGDGAGDTSSKQRNRHFNG